MNVGLLMLELFLPASGSLKDKRKVLRSLQSRLRNRHNLAISEVDHHDLWQRATLAVVSVAGSRDVLDKMFDSVITEAERAIPGEIVRMDREFLN